MRLPTMAYTSAGANLRVNRCFSPLLARSRPSRLVVRLVLGAAIRCSDDCVQLIMSFDFEQVGSNACHTVESRHGQAAKSKRGREAWEKRTIGQVVLFRRRGNSSREFAAPSSSTMTSLSTFGRGP